MTTSTSAPTLTPTSTAPGPFRRTGLTETGQTTAEYALVILGAAALGTLLISWATKSHAITKLFDTVIGRILP